MSALHARRSSRSSSASIVLGALIGVVTYVTLLERKFAARCSRASGRIASARTACCSRSPTRVKLMMKEDIVPAAADRRIFNLAPVVFLIPCMLIFATIPFAPGLGVADLNIGVLFFLAVSSMEIVGLFMAGWGSNNKYALLSAMRAVNQIISYDLPFIIAALVPVLLAGSLRLSDIAAAQHGLWFVFYPVIGQLALPRVRRRQRRRGESHAVRHPRGRVRAGGGLPRRVLGHEVRASSSSASTRTSSGTSFLGALLFLGAWAGPGPGVAGPAVVPAARRSFVFLADHLGAVELRPHPRRSDPRDLLEAAAAR